ncbi:hypothetical protein [Saccharospirillum salsuginis]|uniref:Uncharacterized protein n=1 Tax=Saccharospirillum salsuginis TaxID=418750 RepID=A0A918NAC2_9GAMM|nr:hypothetical protein [Saccharospirillum salsuginis]GGX56045.1 hypothetical protein GCM10007392_24790 [Saccharospirillum salsuginis]
MELYLTIKGQVEAEHEAAFKEMFNYMLGGKTGAPLENFVQKTFPMAEANLEKALDVFEEFYSTPNLETYELKQGQAKLSFMGGRDLESASLYLVAWLEDCGLRDVEQDSQWI